VKRRALSIASALFIACVATPVAYVRLSAKTARVTAGTIGERLVARAVVVPEAGITDVVSHDAGRVTRVLVREGDRVAKGDTLAELEALGDDVKDEPASIAAPADGVVLQRRVERGDTVPSASHGGLVLFTIADPGKTELRVEVEEEDAERLAAGLAVTITAPGGRGVLGHGHVARVSQRIEPRTTGLGDARVRAAAGVRAAWVAWDEPPKPALAIGRTLEASMEIAARRVEARVPRSAILVRNGRTVLEIPWGIWFRERVVDVGATDAELAEVHGITEGTLVLVH
jgi:multidrug efflux pump subunit AcrA (membrane-fusion protein)